MAYKKGDKQILSSEFPIKCIANECDGELAIHDLRIYKCDRCDNIYDCMQVSDYYDVEWERERDWIKCEDCDGEFMRKEMSHYPKCDECDLVREEERKTRKEISR